MASEKDTLGVCPDQKTEERVISGYEGEKQAKRVVRCERDARLPMTL